LVDEYFETRGVFRKRNEYVCRSGRTLLDWKHIVEKSKGFYTKLHAQLAGHGLPDLADKPIGWPQNRDDVAGAIGCGTRMEELPEVEGNFNI
jgi:hypothetical protein